MTINRIRSLFLSLPFDCYNFLVLCPLVVGGYGNNPLGPLPFLLPIVEEEHCLRVENPQFQFISRIAQLDNSRTNTKAKDKKREWGRVSTGDRGELVVVALCGTLRVGPGQGIPRHWTVKLANGYSMVIQHSKARQEDKWAPFLGKEMDQPRAISWGLSQ